MSDEFTCQKCRYHGRDVWVQCAPCELREQMARLTRFKTLCRNLLLALGPCGDFELVSFAAQEARNYHRKYWDPIELLDQSAVDALRDRYREADL